MVSKTRKLREEEQSKDEMAKIVLNLGVKELKVMPEPQVNQQIIDAMNQMKPSGMTDLEWKKLQQKANYPSPGKF